MDEHSDRWAIASAYTQLRKIARELEPIHKGISCAVMVDAEMIRKEYPEVVNEIFNEDVAAENALKNKEEK